MAWTSTVPRSSPQKPQFRRQGSAPAARSHYWVTGTVVVTVIREHYEVVEPRHYSLSSYKPGSKPRLNHFKRHVVAPNYSSTLHSVAHYVTKPNPFLSSRNTALKSIEYRSYYISARLRNWSVHTNSDLAFQACRAPLLVHQSNIIVKVSPTACLQVIWRGDNFRTEGARHASGVRRDRILQDPSAHHEDDQAASRKLTQEPTSS